MTVPLSCPPPASSDSAAAPRKRRRRAPASGASDDCFACTKKNSKCDRRRPYCSQCLEFGSECSGYKTQLTWGVGVASRGKLRGLSLPIAKSAPATPPTTTVPRPTANRSRTASSISRISPPKPSKIKNEDDGETKFGSLSNLPANSYTTYDFINLGTTSATAAMQIPSMSADWTSISREYLEPRSASDQQAHQQLLHQSAPRLSNPAIRRPDLHVSLSAGHLGGFGEHEFGSPLDHTFHIDDAPFLQNSASLYNFSSQQNSPVDQAFGIIDVRGPTSCPDQLYDQSDLSSSLSSHHQTIFEADEPRQAVGSMDETYSASEVFYDDTASALSTSHDHESYMSQSHRGSVAWSSVPENDYITVADYHRDSFSYPAPDYPAPDMHLAVTNEISPRLGFYLDYYEKMICPITVAIDSPSNPYRRSILNLASDSESLQHAICALASCNLRMKRKQAAAQRVWAQQQAYGRQDPFDVCFHRSEDYQPRSEFMFDSPGDEIALAEEHHHRNTAVTLLNSALSSPVLACHDSVLATLFVLCHYRMCASGVAQFRTQFAGAKKLMGMRSSGIETRQWGWMETLFTFFDAITATINDRETQLRGGYLEMIAHPRSPEHALENLAGLDGKLFKIIANLGRLNLLSQQRPVLAPLTNSVPLPSPSPSAPRPRLAGQALVDYYRINPTKFDGNGFATTIPDDFINAPASSDPTDAFPTPTSSSPHSLDNDVQFPPEDLRAQFWREWQSIRLALENWSFSSATLLANLPADSAHITQAEIRDFNLVSEAFRYAALLYTERLACPNVRSSCDGIRHLVQQTLGFVQGLSEGSRMEKFLLWPLFVAGSECTDERLREVVRSACKGISARGGYANNTSALEVLEKIWVDEDADELGVGIIVALPEDSRSPFKWTRHMDPVDGEFIMV